MLNHKGEIPSSKYNNATKSYAYNGTHIFVLMDTTLFGSASDGVAITDYGIEWKNMREEPQSVSWEEIIEYTYNIEVKTKDELLIRGKKIGTISTALDAYAFKDFLKDVDEIFLDMVRRVSPGSIIGFYDNDIKNYFFGMVAPNDEVIFWDGLKNKIVKESINSFLKGNKVITRLLSSNYEISLNKALKEAYCLIGTKLQDIDIEDVKYTLFPLSLRCDNLDSQIDTSYISDKDEIVYLPEKIVEELFEYFEFDKLYITTNDIDIFKNGSIIIPLLRISRFSDKKLKKLEQLKGSKVIQKEEIKEENKQLSFDDIKSIILAISETTESDNDDILEFIEKNKTKNYENILKDVKSDTNKYIKIVFDEISNVKDKEKLNELLTKIINLADDVDLETTIERFQESLSQKKAQEKKLENEKKENEGGIFSNIFKNIFK